MIVLGIDPGGRETGIAVRVGTACLEHAVIKHQAYQTSVVIRAVQEILPRYPGAIVAVEDVVAPNPHMGLSNVEGILATAAVIGGVLAWWPDAVRVPPRGNGSQPLRYYPKQLVGEREKTGTGILRHARSAYDVAGLAPRFLRTRKVIP